MTGQKLQIGVIYNMQRKKLKLSKSAKGALLYMLIVLFIFAALETAVHRITWHYDESNTKAYTGKLSRVEQYTTGDLRYRGIYPQSHIKLYFTDGNVYSVRNTPDRQALLSIPTGETLYLRLCQDPRGTVFACDIRSDSHVFQTMERSSQLAQRNKWAVQALFFSVTLLFLAIGFFYGLEGFRQYFSSLATRRRREKRKRARYERLAKKE